MFRWVKRDKPAPSTGDMMLHQKLTDEIEEKRAKQRQLEQQLADAKLARDKYQLLSIELKKTNKNLQAAEKDHAKVSKTLHRSNSVGAITDKQSRNSAQGELPLPANYSCESLLGQMHQMPQTEQALDEVQRTVQITEDFSFYRPRPGRNSSSRYGACCVVAPTGQEIEQQPPPAYESNIYPLLEAELNPEYSIQRGPDGIVPVMTITPDKYSNAVAPCNVVIPAHLRHSGPADVPAGPRLTSQERALQDRMGASAFDQMRSQLMQSGAAALGRSLPPPQPNLNPPMANYPPPPPIQPPVAKPRTILPTQQTTSQTNQQTPTQPSQQIPQQTQNNTSGARRVQFGGNDGSYVPQMTQSFAPPTASTPKTALPHKVSGDSQHSDMASHHGSSAQSDDVFAGPSNPEPKVIGDKLQFLMTGQNVPRFVSDGVSQIIKQNPTWDIKQVWEEVQSQFNPNYVP